MTEQEALALKPGDRVEAKMGDTWRHCKVLHVLSFNDGSFHTMLVRRIGLQRNGREFTPIYKWNLKQLRPVGANYAQQVYADWLEQEGYPEAAAALRKRFPLADGV